MDKVLFEKINGATNVAGGIFYSMYAYNYGFSFLSLAVAITATISSSVALNILFNNTKPGYKEVTRGGDFILLNEDTDIENRKFNNLQRALKP